MSYNNKMAKRGHEQPIFDHKGEPEETLLSQPKPELVQEVELTAETNTEPKVEKKSVEQIMAEHETRLAERAAKWEEMTNANWPPGRVEQALDALFPDLRSPERIEGLEVRQQADIRRQSRQAAKLKRKPPTRYLSPRDTGPPPRIAREIRGE